MWCCFGQAMADLYRPVGESAAETCHAVSAAVFRSRTDISLEDGVTMLDRTMDTLLRRTGMADAPTGVISATEPRLPPSKAPRLLGGACPF
jgi:hypothetical protein